VSNDPAIQKKAAELTAGATTSSEKARRIYDYVAKDFRYVSLSFGVGRFQPHAASEVLAAGYGDCKDKHTLLQALLRAAGIQSYPVLIGFGRKLDADVPSPAQFNHVITAAKMGTDWTWLDATQEVAPYGHLLYELRNQHALLASDDAMLRREAIRKLAQHADGVIEYRFSEPYGYTGLFAGAGIYRQKTGSREETDYGVQGGITALFPLNRTYAIAVEGAYHWVNVYHPRPRYVTVGAGLRIAF
jgi:hypothetical protein